MPPLAGYLRVSHVGGRKGDSFRSVDDQIAEILPWAKAHGHDVTILPPELDAKGSDGSRPVFREAIAGVKSGRFAGVVVAYQSRAGRDMRLMLDLWEEIEGAGGVFYSARENIDGSTTSGRLHRNILASINQAELEERREDFERQRKSATERGIWQRRQMPRGYVRDPETRRLVEGPDADLVREAFRAYLAGGTTVSVADMLGMTPGGARRLLRNRVYLGELRVGSHVNPSAHPPIVDVATFEAVGAKLDANVRPARRSDEIALLAGIVRCASCGHVMTRGSRTSKGGAAYTCPALHSGERCPAPAAIVCHLIDPYVEEIALRELDRLEIVASKGDRIAKLRAKRDEAVANLEAFVERFSAATIGDLYDRQLAKRVAAVEEAEAELAAENSRAMLPGTRSAYPDLTRDHQNVLLRSLLAAAVVRPSGRGRRLPVAERCRVFRHGSLALPERRGGEGTGIAPLPFPDTDVEGVLS